MVPKLTVAGVVALSCCLSYEQFWQYCGACGVKVLREGGETGMPAQVLHVTNQGQSVRQRVKEGMKGRPVGLPDNSPPPCPWGSDLREAPMYTSLVFNEVVGLHVHNQQEYKLVVDHEFLDCLGWQWSLHAMVLHIGSTREEAHFVVYVVFNDRWWLCNDTTVKVMTPPPPTREKRRFCYTSANKQIWLYQTCRSQPPNGKDLQPLVRHGMPRAYLLHLGASHGAGTGCVSPLPLLQHRVHQGLGTGRTGLCMPRACLWTPLCQPRRWHEVHPPLPQLQHRAHQG